MNKVTLLIFIISFAVVSNLTAQEFVENIAVIVHESIETNLLSEKDLLEIYTLSNHNWSDENRIKVADYKGENYLRILFYNSLNLTPRTIKKLWLRAQFTGRTVPPKVVDSISDMIDLVKNNPGTIGYVPITRVPPEVKVIFEIRNDL
ncbi:MAG: hypothetical protein JJ895_14365 [Balneolaceae bacterium]|nr:hypothetical protein [Balneolaceae bacterium]